MFTISTYSELRPGGVYSSITGGFVGLGDVGSWAEVGSLEVLPAEVRKQLIANEVICPEGVDEAAFMEERLLAQDKLTVLVRDGGLDFWGELEVFVRRFQIRQVSVVFINPGEIGGLGRLEGLKEARFFVLEDGRELSALKREGDRWVKESLCWNRARKRDSARASVVMSDYRYVKELPLRGLVVDAELLSVDLWKLHPRCRSCRMLASCGGYTEGVAVRCPSFEEVEVREGTAVSVGSNAGVSNSLTLNGEIGKLFDWMIARNASSSELLLLDYLACEYHRAFSFSKAGQVRLAAAMFRQLDGITEGMGRGFAWRWIQSHAASTRSYLAFKTGGYKKAIAITEEAIGHAVSLLDYPASAVMTLFISQMLLNKAKVLLTVKDYAGWEETMLVNIQYLANLDVPEECRGMDKGVFEGLDVGLRHWMLMEGIGQVLKFSLTNRDLPHGERLLAGICANRQDAVFDEQLREWVRLLQAVERRDMGFVKACLPDFMAERNAGTGIGALQGYVQMRVRGLRGKFKNDLYE